mgnify:CR=1 FL=1
MLKSFGDYRELWEIDPAEKVRRFEDEQPLYSDYGNQIRHFANMIDFVGEIPDSHKLGPISFDTELLRLALVTECQNWKRAFGIALNNKAAGDMDKIFETVEDQKKRLSRPINDLDDIRSSMASLKELREKEIYIEMTIGPIEEAYGLLNRFELAFNDGNQERVDTIGYAWRNTQSQAKKVQGTLLTIQGPFQSNLISGVEQFKEDTQKFYKDFDTEGPLVEGITPAEASDRVTVYQSRFDELWRKYLTYSGGEELFGMPVTEYDDLQRIRKELNLLQKLYGLYNQVLESVSGYYDILWTDLDIDKINNDLLDFQTRCRKLPKGLKEWDAFIELKSKIDDFSESCPLLEQMSNNAMLRRHWDRIERLTGATFNIEDENFALRGVMEAPLLKHQEDLEDICISAVKERDIEQKLKLVIGEWENQELTFAPFKTRGELLFKGADISEIVVLLEDSLMVLSSLMSNRYNAPFRPKIQEWVQKLSGSTEIIEQLLQTQNLWVYLEAVFVGGDIAKQLPQEAKRFGNIDKSWQKIMQKAHETTNVVKCCMGDDMYSQLLPHLLEQLEICQKSLTGYLEAKRLLFPRFFFVSDPALLEILGQASDCHTIQQHLLSLFDNVHRVIFDTKVYDKVLTMVSQEGEEVDLQPAVICQGNVELWLKNLMDTVHGTVHTTIRRAWQNLSDSGFDIIRFEDTFPAQVGLLGIQLLWTRDSEQALNECKYDRAIMEKTNQSFLDLLNLLIEMTTKELTKRERVKYETLITIHVHQRDIFDEMCKLRVRNVTDFEWQKQCRFYYDEDFDKCRISVTDVDFTYCNEYTGCTDRLVITPLTD